MNQFLSKYRNRALIVGEQLVVSGGNFLSGVFIAKILGLDIYSVFATIQIIQLFFGGFHQALIIAPLTSIYPGLKNNKELFIGTLFGIHLMFVSGLLIIVTVILILDGNFIQLSIFRVLVYIVLLLSYDVIRKILFIENQHLMLIGLNMIAYVLPMGILFTDTTAISIDSILWSYSACIGISLTIGLYLKRNLLSSKLFHIHSFKMIWSFSKWLLAKSIVQWFAGNYFIIVGGILLGNSAVGAIRIIQNLFGLFNVILMVCENYLSVKSAKIKAAYGIVTLRKFQHQIFLKLGIMVSLILITLSCFSPTILRLVYGEVYTSYYYLVIAFSVLYFFIFINLSPRFILRASLITKPIFISYVISALFGLISAYYLVDKFELTGVVLGLIGSQIIILIWNKLAVNRLVIT